MNNLLLLFKRKFLPAAGVVLFSAISIAGASLAAYKLSRASLGPNANTAAQTSLKTAQGNPAGTLAKAGDYASAGRDDDSAAESLEDGSSARTNSDDGNFNFTAAAGSNPAPSQIPAQAALAAATTPAAASAAASNRCIITIQAKQYDVTRFRLTHPGGNIFQCGTDMTAAYTAQHGNNTSQIQKYLVTGTTASGSQSSGSALDDSQSGAGWEQEDKNHDDDKGGATAQADHNLTRRESGEDD